MREHSDPVSDLHSVWYSLTRGPPARCEPSGYAMASVGAKYLRHGNQCVGRTFASADLRSEVTHRCGPQSSANSAGLIRGYLPGPRLRNTR